MKQDLSVSNLCGSSSKRTLVEKGKMGQRGKNANKSYVMKPVIQRELSSDEEAFATL